LSGLRKLEQLGNNCIELRGQSVGYVLSLVAVAWFLPGRGKDLSAPPHAINMKIDYSNRETMTKLISTCNVQFCVLFSYKLCACHITGCHYTQALFHSVLLQVKLFLARLSFLPHTWWEMNRCGLLCSEQW
jgi:hypothetical protein